MIRILLTLVFLMSSAFAQNLSKPELLGTWRKGFEDFGEFMYHKVELVKFSYLKYNPGGKLVARICTPDKEMSRALANSVGFAFVLPFYTRTLEVPDDKIFFARYSQCGRSEEYWFIPESVTLDYDEILPLEKVKFNRFIENYFPNPNAPEAKKDFADKTTQFIKELKNNPKAKGYVILNIRTQKRYFRQALREIQKEGIDKTRFQILEKGEYETHYPEFMTFSIDN